MIIRDSLSKRSKLSRQALNSQSPRLCLQSNSKVAHVNRLSKIRLLFGCPWAIQRGFLSKTTLRVNICNGAYWLSRDKIRLGKVSERIWEEVSRLSSSRRNNSLRMRVAPQHGMWSQTGEGELGTSVHLCFLAGCHVTSCLPLLPPCLPCPDGLHSQTVR